ncbi:MAG: SPFH/Band 7/PHB domain protein [Alphaproteobacteria bacterium GM7ARS4]|nr:SPFH/Band 7/PHB domain protein [Alphaproteobacteria bacterium GM7ARS4]
MTNFETLILLVVIFFLVLVYKGVEVVPQSQVHLVERFGRYTKTLAPGLNFIVPFLDIIAHRVSILERQLPEFKISVITKDNVEVGLESTVFYRIVDAPSSVYRIRHIDKAVYTASTSIVRSAAGKLELDELQSSRESMNQEIAVNLSAAAEIWGVEVTRTEITDIVVDERTKESQRQQLDAERERRAMIAKAEGERRSVELRADAELYEAEKQADAIKVKADAEAYEVRVKAEADAKQTTLLAQAIKEDGQPAIDFEILKRQVHALSAVATSNNTKTLIIPTDIAAVLGSLETILQSIRPEDKKRPPSMPVTKKP